MLNIKMVQLNIFKDNFFAYQKYFDFLNGDFPEKSEILKNNFDNFSAISDVVGLTVILGS